MNAVDITGYKWILEAILHRYEISSHLLAFLLGREEGDILIDVFVTSERGNFGFSSIQ